MQVTFIGHSTVLIELDGFRFLTDPVLRDRLIHLRRRVQPVDKTLLDSIDAVLISHLHYDHADLPSLRMIDRSTPIITPRGIGSLLRKTGFRDIREVSAGEALSFGEVSITATHAEHYVKRHPFTAQSDAIGFMIAGSYNAYFAGDTDIFDGMEQLSEQIDLALLPVWGWGSKLGPGHLTPERAAAALVKLRPRFAIPIHWGTLSPVGKSVAANRWLSDPPHEFARIAKSAAPEVEVQVIAPGSGFRLT